MAFALPSHGPIIATKLSVPPVRNTLVRRSRLTALLDHATQVPITLVSAPAGFGKTTLVAQWAHDATTAQRRVAWVTLDAADDEPRRFWMCVLRAIERVYPGLTTALLADLALQQPLVIEQTFTAFINVLAAVDDPLCIVLDDYHAITDTAIHAALAFVLEQQLPHLHVVVTTRADPPVPLARWRARGWLGEIRTDHLRCTDAEATMLLTDVLQVALDPATIATIYQRSEGWPVGIHLFGLWLQRHADVDDRLAELHGNQHYIVDYLIEDVLRQQPTEVQTFLLHTALLDHLYAPLCDAVLQRTDSQALLDYVERANLFVDALDGQRHWFRYHHLFAEALRYQVEQRDPDAVPGVHRRASRWYAATGNLDAAFRHAFQARDWEYAVSLLAPLISPPPWNQVATERQQLRAWIEHLPVDVRRAHPRVGLTLGVIYLSSGLVPDALTWLHAAETACRATLMQSTAAAPERDLLGEICVARALLASIGNTQPAVWELVAEAQEYLAPENHLAHALLHYIRAILAYHAGNGPDTIHAMLEASGRARLDGNADSTYFYLAQKRLGIACGKGGCTLPSVIPRSFCLRPNAWACGSHTQRG